MRDPSTNHAAAEAAANQSSPVQASIPPRDGPLARIASSPMMARLRAQFAAQNMTFWTVFLPCLVVAAVLYTRSFGTNFIFDEQEALLANPYVNGKKLQFFDVVRRDFWGLAPERSVGSYRPLPNVLWRLLADGTRGAQAVLARVPYVAQYHKNPAALSPWIFHWCNVALHAVNGALLITIVYALTRKRPVAWIAGFVFTACAVLTEAVSGVVGTADVLGGLGALLAIAALRLPLWAMPLGVFGGLLLGLFSKESAIVCIPLVPLAALWLAPFFHPQRPLRAARCGAALVASVVACVLYVTARKHWFPSPVPAELLAPLAPDASRLTRGFRAFLVWFHQPPLPKDPLNNPLVAADVPHRVAGALRVWWRALSQLVFPKTLSGDYSFRAEPVPDHLISAESVLGALMMVVPIFGGIACWIRALLLERRASRAARLEAIERFETAVRREPFADGSLAGLSHPPPPALGAEETVSGRTRARAAEWAIAGVGLVWLVVSYFPHSNIAILLPTVRAERFLYFPALGSSLVLAVFFAWSIAKDRPRRLRTGGAVFLGAFLMFQCVRARMHALDYADDLAFWGATKDAVPLSAKAHLNYSVMWGARSRLDIRLTESRIAADLAPKWPMAHIYLGDTLCRLHRASEAWPHYVDGFKIAENEPNLIALALQCLWDEKAIDEHQDELEALSRAHPGSWLDYLIRDILDKGEQHNGVDPKYRPRGYNEGPKD